LGKIRSLTIWPIIFKFPVPNSCNFCSYLAPSVTNTTFKIAPQMRFDGWQIVICDDEMICPKNYAILVLDLKPPGSANVEAK